MFQYMYCIRNNWSDIALENSLQTKFKAHFDKIGIKLFNRNTQSLIDSAIREMDKKVTQIGDSEFDFNSNLDQI